MILKDYKNSFTVLFQPPSTLTAAVHLGDQITPLDILFNYTGRVQTYVKYTASSTRAELNVIPRNPRNVNFLMHTHYVNIYVNYVFRQKKKKQTFTPPRNGVKKSLCTTLNSHCYANP